MNDLTRARHRAMLVGALIAVLGCFGATALLGGRPAQGQQARTSTGLTLPAVTLSPGQIALVKDASGRFFLIDTQGNAAPVRFRDTVLRDSPGESILLAP